MGSSILPPLLEKAFPSPHLSSDEEKALVRLQDAIDNDIAPAAAEHDRLGRYPTAAVAALKRSGILATAVPHTLGGIGVSQRFPLEVQVRLAAVDSAVAQIFKIHDELSREILVYCPAALKSVLVAKLLTGEVILGLAVAEATRKVDDPLATTCMPQPDGGFVIDGKKIYTTGAAEADYIAVWSFNPAADGVAENALMGAQLNLVPPTTAGVTIHRDWNTIGQRATDSGTISFANVKTDPLLKASIPGKGPLPYASLRYIAGFAACMVGIGIGAIRAAAPFVRHHSRPWPSGGVDNAADDPYVRRLTGELVADLAAAYALTLAGGDLLDSYERGEIDRTSLAVPIYAAKAAASRAGLRAASEIYALMGTRAVSRVHGFDRFWRNARTLSLHDPVDWKHAEIGRHVLTGWEPPPGLYQ
jgi:alkylation response protein AidB-like acyl-CoA dehydrogenase